MKQKTEQKQNRRRKADLLGEFLHGNKRYFVVTLLASVIASLAELISPQIIRVALDQVIGAQPTDTLAAPIQRLLSLAGGTAYLRGHLYVMALAIVAVAAVGCVRITGFTAALVTVSFTALV